MHSLEAVVWSYIGFRYSVLEVIRSIIGMHALNNCGSTARHAWLTLLSWQRAPTRQAELERLWLLYSDDWFVWTISFAVVWSRCYGGGGTKMVIINSTMTSYLEMYCRSWHMMVFVRSYILPCGVCKVVKMDISWLWVLMQWMFWYVPTLWKAI